ncbi:hypothetical protein DSOL_4964 [Desulfosporosinus metallidurans]|uniref:Uncharacterized protein n=1 Tax=Desulfosporosinus metallidurans TaxID=1888891 RepID=A0A1Q8QGK8_9FIRM|nr:hypothetical protein DSOL_4964 [Desulfosporosinus metallidurans]
MGYYSAFSENQTDRGIRTSPYTCLGLADVQNHYGSAQISIVWKMKESCPGFVMKKTVKV